MEKLKVTQYEVIDRLPDLFAFEDGSLVKTREDWRKRRQELIHTAVELQYGTLPPEPEFLEVQPLYLTGPSTHKDPFHAQTESYRVTSGTREHPVSFTMVVHRPKAAGKLPVVIDGDMCWGWSSLFDKKVMGMYAEKNIMVVKFNRCEIVPDVRGLPRNSPIQLAYPDKTFGAIVAWAWGYSRCVDALEKLGLADMDHIVFTGLSRGAKTALVAGALDERAWLVNPEAPCAGGSCYRLRMKAITEDGDELRSEELEDITTNFPDWMGPEMPTYKGRVPELPFDEHSLKALVAPRILFDSEAKSDIWASPLGAYQTNIAAREAWRMLGAEENILWYWRDGYHDQTEEDFSLLLNLIENRLHGEKLDERFFNVPFDLPEPIHTPWAD